MSSTLNDFRALSAHLELHPTLRSELEQVMMTCVSRAIQESAEGRGANESETVRTRPRHPEDTLQDVPRSTAAGAPGGGGIGYVGADIPQPSPSLFSERYELLQLLGRGGAGEVWRVLDHTMGRNLAIKFLKKHPPEERSLSRFMREAQITSQMQHPGIVPVHDVGRLTDGRWYYTMKEVYGRTLTSLISRFHSQVEDKQLAPAAERITLRRLLDIFLTVCQTVAYAHSCGVIHRDLKPDNVMVGQFGEVLVLDWGIAKVVGAQTPGDSLVVSPPIESREDDQHHHTEMGDIVGTLTYMAPEQAAGEVDNLTPATDVFALGLMLYEILCGQAAYGRGTLTHMILQAYTARPRPLRELLASQPEQMVSDELIQVVERAMERSSQDRFPDAGALAEQIQGWLEGAQRRDRALQVVRQADELLPEIGRLREVALVQKSVAETELKALRPLAPVTQKGPLWRSLEQAEELLRQADLMQIDYLQKLRGALEIQTSLPEAHQRLATYYHGLHQDAEAGGDVGAAAQAEVLLRTYVRRGEFAAYLKGDGALSLVTEPARAEVLLYRYVQRDRRLIPEYVGVLGHTPLHGVSLPQGSYLLKLRAPGRADVLYPVYIARQEHWDGIPPQETTPYPIYLPRYDEVGSHECYVPAGWFWLGGDKEAFSCLPKQRMWVDGFVVKTFTITNAEYLTFLNNLVDLGRGEQALRWAPRERAGAPGTLGDLLLGRDHQGHFYLRIDSDGDEWRPDESIGDVDWYSCRAYAQWEAERTGLEWRLPFEYEWEKAARGVDGRYFPFGNFIDPTWASYRDSHEGRPRAHDVDTFPLDESPYGIRAMAGGCRVWCLEQHQTGQIIPPSPRLQRIELPEVPEGFRLIRGGSWCHVDRFCRVANRWNDGPGSRSSDVGMRLIRSFH